MHHRCLDALKKARLNRITVMASPTRPRSTSIDPAAISTTLRVTPLPQRLRARRRSGERRTSTKSVPAKVKK